MHKLQQHILHQLIHHSDQRYADLKPVGVEGNLFMYHLRQLMRAGHVSKRLDGRYELSSGGKRYADLLNVQTLTPRAQPRIIVLMACRNDVGEWLFFRRHRQPLLAMAGFPYGKIELGETIAQAADRELGERTGLKADLIHRGDGYITICQAGEPVSQIMFHLFYGHQPRGKLTHETSEGTAFWAPATLIDSTFMPSVIDLLKLINADDKRFFIEQTYYL